MNMEWTGLHTPKRWLCGTQLDLMAGESFVRRDEPTRGWPDPDLEAKNIKVTARAAGLAL